MIPHLWLNGETGNASDSKSGTLLGLWVRLPLGLLGGLAATVWGGCARGGHALTAFQLLTRYWGLGLANMLGTRALQRYGMGDRHCPCCRITPVVQECKHSMRQAEKNQWRSDTDADLASDWCPLYPHGWWAAMKWRDPDPGRELPPGMERVTFVS